MQLIQAGSSFTYGQEIDPVIVEAVERGMVGENVCAWVKERREGGEDGKVEGGEKERHVRWKGSG